MSNITAGMVKDLRDKTGAGMMDCKNALNETGGDMEAAIDWLRKKGISKAAKKAGRAAAEGLRGRRRSGGDLAGTEKRAAHGRSGPQGPYHLLPEPHASGAGNLHPVRASHSLS